MSQRPRLMMISTHGYVAARPELGKADTGGQVVYVLELSRRLAREGLAVDVLTRRFEDQPEVEWISDLARIVRIPCGGAGFVPKEVLCEHVPEWVERASAWIERHDTAYQLVLSHYWDGGMAGQALADRLGLPHVHTPHSLGEWKQASMDGGALELEAQYNFRRRIAEERRIYHAADLLIATTDPQKTLLEQGYDVAAARIEVVPPGCDEDRFRPVSAEQREAIRRRLGFRGPVVLSLGRPAVNKGYDLLLRAMPPVFARLPEARLYLAVGSPHPRTDELRLRAELAQLARTLGFSDRVTLGHHIKDEELADHYRAADVFALSSRYEPFGMTAVEAMACGTPAVLTTEGGLKDQIVWGLEALVGNPFDPEAYGHQILNALAHPTWAEQLRRHGSRKARSAFSWSGIARRLTRLWSRLPVPALATDQGQWTEATCS